MEIGKWLSLNLTFDLSPITTQPLIMLFLKMLAKQLTFHRRCGLLRLNRVVRFYQKENVLKFCTGIDDIASSSAKSAGWTIIAFDALLLDDFNIKAQDILTRSKLDSFHAKEFKRAKASFYTEFFNLIKTTLAQKEFAFICCTLMSESWKAEFVPFCGRVIDKSFKDANIDDQEVIEASKRLAAPLFTFLKTSAAFNGVESTTIDIDEDVILKGILKDKIIVNSHKISPQLPIFAALKAYRQNLFPNSPLIERESINVVDDKKSFLVQAADMFGNFSVALVFQILGKVSKTNDFKCEIFLSVFGDIIDTSQIISNVEILDEDIILKKEGALTLIIQ